MARMYLAIVLALTIFSTPAKAEPGKPVAVRWWGQGMVSIETYWDFHIVIDPFDTSIGYVDPNLVADLVLVTHDHPDHNNVELIAGNPKVARGLDDDGKVQSVYRALDRFPGQEDVRWYDARQRTACTPHAVIVTSIAAWHDDSQGSKRGATAMFLVEVDGVRIVHCGDLGQTGLTDEQLEQMGTVDVLLLPVGGKYTADGEQAAAIVRQVGPRFVVPIHYKTPALKIDLQPVDAFVAALEGDYKVARPASNTLAVSVAKKAEPPKPQLVVLPYQAWQMPEELAGLFARKELACRDSQAVFAPLSAEQMNHKPSDGTHSPRWNAEHMMGRELGFFSQIYAAIDPEISPIDLNPAQMPPDYKAANPGWDGAEEARQMQRVSDFTLRFSYLLADLPLDERAPDSRWTPRGLLEQMQRHYGEHTANVKKKFEMPDWPKE